MSETNDSRSALLWLLAPSFLFGTETWRDVAGILTERGDVARIANPARPRLKDKSFVLPWAEAVAATIPPGTETRIVVVGHSASCPRLPLVASILIERGFDVAGIILVNGRFPADGRAPVEEDEPLAEMLDGLVRPNSYLPPWYRWWGSLVIDMLPDEAARKRIFSQAHCVPRVLFDEPIPAPALPATIGQGYLTMGEMYRPSHDRAVAEGWCVAEIAGEHLHMVVAPANVADALCRLVDQFAAAAAS